MLAGLVLGSYGEQWGEIPRKVDFLILKRYTSIFALTLCSTIASAQQSALHPGQTAEILSPDGKK